MATAERASVIVLYLTEDEAAVVTAVAGTTCVSEVRARLEGSARFARARMALSRDGQNPLATIYQALSGVV